VINRLSSALDGGHVRLVVALAGGWGEVVQASDLLHAQLDSVGCRVLLDAGDAFGAGMGAMSSPWASSQAKAICAVQRELPGTSRGMDAGCAVVSPENKRDLGGMTSLVSDRLRVGRRAQRWRRCSQARR
jgi:hypothetical protein